MKPFFKRYVPLVLSVLSFFMFFVGCAVVQKAPIKRTDTALVRVRPSECPDFYDDMSYDGLAYAIRQSILYLKKIPEDRHFRFGEETFDTNHMITSLERFLGFISTKPSEQLLTKYIDTHYLVYSSIGDDNFGRMLFTGYYEPFLEGCLVKSDQCRYPVYSRPDDLVTVDLSLFSSRFQGETITGRYNNQTVVPYYSRREIEFESALEGKARSIAWLKDSVDLFFLQIQGSGKIHLDNGDTINVHYYGTNGRPYRSIGKLLIDEGKIPRSEMSMQKIRAYLHTHPEDVESILSHNPSYVFFKVEKDGPLGYLEVKLTPGRSIALDRRLFPLSGLAFIETEKPIINGNGKIDHWEKFKRFVLAHDTGGAVTGPGRADLFCGNGPYAEIAAGHMQQTGRLYFLVLRPDAV
jgi:membrane-bound lytic murein transglycosylase A